MPQTETGRGSRLPAAQRQTIQDTAKAIERHQTAVYGPWAGRVQQALEELPDEVYPGGVIGLDDATRQENAAIREAAINSVEATCDQCGEPVPIEPAAKGDDHAKAGHKLTSCPRCYPNAAAILDVARGQTERDHKAQELHHQLRDRREEHSATVPGTYGRASITGYQTNNANEQAARDYLDAQTPESWPIMLTLGGPPGTGKTYLGAAICRRWRFRFNRDPLMIDEAHVAQLWRDAHKPGSDDDPADIIQTLQHADLLVIDDLGKARPTPGWSSEIHGVIDSRLQAGRPTVTTTNLNRASLTAAYGERFGPSLVSRMGEGVVLPVDGPDRRRGWDASSTSI